MRINLQTYEKCYPKRLKKFFQADINYRTYNEFIPHIEHAIVGNIPPEIIRLFPKNTRGEDIRRFQDTLAETACCLRKVYNEIKYEENFSYYDKNYRPSIYMKKLEKAGEICLNSKLTNIFLEENISASLRFTGYGSFANVYQLTLKDKNGHKIMHDKALKVYNSIREGDPRYFQKHNSYAEANFWIFLKRIAGHSLAKTQFTQHYISDLRSGYCITEFIDSEISKTSSKLPIYELFNFGIPHDISNNPSLIGKVYDGGGYGKGRNFVSDKVTLKYIKMLFYAKGKASSAMLEKLMALATNPKTPFRDKIQIAIEQYKINQKGHTY